MPPFVIKKKERGGGNPTHCQLYVVLEGSQRSWYQAVSGKGLGDSGGKETHFCPNFYTAGLIHSVQPLSQQFTPISGWGNQMRGRKQVPWLVTTDLE